MLFEICHIEICSLKIAEVNLLTGAPQQMLHAPSMNNTVGKWEIVLGGNLWVTFYILETSIYILEARTSFTKKGGFEHE